MTENQIQEKILKRLQRYTEHVLKKPSFGRKWYFVEQHLIRFGRDRIGRADITLLINGKPFMIVECKRPGVSPTEISEGKEQLESYLNASRANLGIFANNDDPQKWTYYDNSSGFDKIDHSKFWKKISAAFDTKRDIEKKAQQQKQQRISERAKQLVTSEAIKKRADMMIDEEAEIRVNEKSIRDAVVWQLQQKIKRLESQLQEETNRLEFTIDNLRTALEESRNRGTWGWILFGISVVLLIAVASS